MAGILAFSTFTACKKESGSPAGINLPNKKAGGNWPVFTTRQQISSHLEWIARGMAHWPKSHAFVNYVDSVTNIYSNDSLTNSLAFIQSQYIFANPLRDTINLRLSGHDFDTDGILGFYFHTWEMGTVVYIPEPKPNEKPFVVVPQNMDADSVTDMALKGYFLNSLGQLDSVMIDPDNYEDYYIWLIDIWSPHEYYDLWESSGSGGGDLPRRKSMQWKVECNPDVYCSPAEQFRPDCPECPGELYRLEIAVLRVRTDNHTYRERFLGGKYEFTVSAGFIQDETDFIYHPNNNLKFHKLKGRDVCRKKGNSIKFNSNNCDSADHYIGYTLCDQVKIHPHRETKLAIVFFERDRIFSRRESYIIHDQKHTVHNWTSDHCFGPFNNPFMATSDFYPYLWVRTFQSVYGSGLIDLKALSQHTQNGREIWLNTQDEADILIKLIKL